MDEGILIAAVEELGALTCALRNGQIRYLEYVYELELY